MCKVCFVRFIQSFTNKPPCPPCLVIQLTLGMAVAIRCDSANCPSSLYCMGGFQQMLFVTKTCCGCGTGVWCCHSVVCHKGKGKTDFFLSGCSECLKAFSCLLWPCFGLSLQDTPFVVWLMFIRVGLFMMGSENRNRSLISF